MARKPSELTSQVQKWGVLPSCAPGPTCFVTARGSLIPKPLCGYMAPTGLTLQPEVPSLRTGQGPCQWLPPLPLPPPVTSIAVMSGNGSGPVSSSALALLLGSRNPTLQTSSAHLTHRTENQAIPPDNYVCLACSSWALEQAGSWKGHLH